MSRAVANTLLPAGEPASTIARPRPRELPVTNHTCAIQPPLSSHPRIFWRSFSNSGLDAQRVYERTLVTKEVGGVAHLCIAPFPRRVTVPCVFCQSLP